MFNTLLPEKSILPAHPWANMAGRRNKKLFYICSEVIDSITDANSGCLGRGLGRFRCGLRWFEANMAGQCNTQQTCLYGSHMGYPYGECNRVRHGSHMG